MYQMKMLSHIWGPTDQQTDQLLELLEWLFATKNGLNGVVRVAWSVILVTRNSVVLR